MVLEKVIIYPSQSQTYERWIEGREEVTSFIKDVYDRNHIALTTMDRAITRTNNVLSTCLDIKGVQRFHLAAFVIYNILIEDDTPRTIDQISYYTNVSVAKIWGMQKFIPAKVMRTEHCIEVIGRELELNYRNVLTVEKIVSIMSGSSGVQTATIIATVIYLYMKEIHSVPKLLLKDICTACNVSPGSVHKFISKLSPVYVKKISTITDHVSI